MIIDKLGKQVKCDDQIAIAELILDNLYKCHSALKFARVLRVDEKSLVISYNLTGELDSDFINTEFIILPSLCQEFSIYTEIEKLSRGFVSV